MYYLKEKMLKYTPLYKEHLNLNARIGPFAGWNMPITYASIIEEHLHTRSKAGLFDICHMGEFLLKGKTASLDIDYLLTPRTDNMHIGRCRYGFLLNREGKIMDDLIVFKVDEDKFMFVVNAACIEKDKEWIKSHISDETEFEDLSEKTAKLDLQGPLSKDILSFYTDVMLDKIDKYHFLKGRVCGVEALVSRTGYTGELGYELYFSVKEAVNIWRAFLKNKDVRPIGLGARDTLRLEMGYPLYGHDIDEQHTPLEANLEKFVYMEKEFIGKDALVKQKSTGIKNIHTGFICDGRRSPRQDFAVLSEGEIVGEVTSGSFSPCLKKAIGLCYINTDIAREGNKIIITDGKISIEATVKNPPFVK